MIRYALSAMARRELADIYQFSLQRWGVAQADRYIGEMFETFAAIGDGQARSRPLSLSDVDGEVTIFRSHYIYWFRSPYGEARIATILHQHMVQADRVRIAFHLPD